MTCDVEVKDNDLDTREYALNQCAARIAAFVVGKLDSDEQLSRCDCADRNISVGATKLIGFDGAAFQRDLCAAIENQSFHGSLIGATPVRRRSSARSSSIRGLACDREGSPGAHRASSVEPG